MLQSCLNGARAPGEHPRLPITSTELAADAAACVAAGAASVHFHPRGSEGRETLSARACAEAIAAVRQACPGVPLGLSTALWIEGSPVARLRAIEEWTVVPDFVSVNFSEPGVEALCRQLTEMGVAIEAGLASEADAIRLIASGITPLRVLVEVQQDAVDPVLAAVRIEERVVSARVPLLVHGEGRATWPVLEHAVRCGFESRIGLEDTLVDANGSPVEDNLALVRMARALRERVHSSK